MLQLDYAVDTDAYNAVGEARGLSVSLTVRNQDGMPAPKGVRVTLEASYDDGRSWTKATKVSDLGGGRFTAAVERPSKVRGDAFVTLRVTAVDSSGNRIEQTVERAYLHRG